MDRHLERPQYREVAAARAPRRLDLGLVRVHLELEFHATASKTLSAMSRHVKGSPSYFPKKWSGLYPVSARRRRVNWPVSFPSIARLCFTFFRRLRVASAWNGKRVGNSRLFT